MEEYKVSLRGGFADRNGLQIENTELQTTSLDNRTRMAIRNALHNIYHHRFGSAFYNDEKDSFWRSILSNVYIKPVEYDRQYDGQSLLPIIDNTIMKDDYASVLTLVEFMVRLLAQRDHLFDNQVVSYVNHIFEKEYVGYRYIDKWITPITDDVEIAAIDEACNNPLEETNKHIKKALEHISNRDNPDYANSIKESISAVEAMCAIIVGKTTTLGDALNQLKKSNVIIHPALYAAFDKLYGYTSDANGVRHAGQLGGQNATFEEAKFMLVSCSAFVNHLKGVRAKVT